MSSQWEFAVWCREPKASAPWQLRGWVGERETWERGSRGMGYIHTYGRCILMYGNVWWRVATSFSRGSSQPRIEPWSPTLQTDSLPLSHKGSPSLSLTYGWCVLMCGNAWWRVATSFSRGSSQPRTEPWSPTLQTDSLPLSHKGSPSLTLTYGRCMLMCGGNYHRIVK